jgi:hypothetical protein
MSARFDIFYRKVISGAFRDCGLLDLQQPSLRSSGGSERGTARQNTSKRADSPEIPEMECQKALQYLVFLHVCNPEIHPKSPDIRRFVL